jgi:hypothetical protein
MQLEEKLLQWVGHITRMPRGALELIFKGKRPTTEQFSQVLEDIKKRRKNWKETKKERLLEKRRGWRLCPSTHIKQK